jgi:hypothetical protein
MLRAFFGILGLTFQHHLPKTRLGGCLVQLLNLVRPVEQQVEAFAQIGFFVPCAAYLKLLLRRTG